MIVALGDYQFISISGGGNFKSSLILIWPFSLKPK